MSRPAILFITYYRIWPTAQIGVFKRCMRLIRHLLDDYDIHVVHYGPRPEEEPLYASMRDRLTMHEIDQYDNNSIGRELQELMEKHRFAAVINGEAPLRGSVRMVDRVAATLGIWQIAVDNLYFPGAVAMLADEFPTIDRWLLLGLLEDGSPGARLTPSTVVVPPLVRFPRDFGHARDRITIYGYDPQTLRTGVHLLEMLPSSERVDFFVSPQTRPMLDASRAIVDAHDVRVLELPDDLQIAESLSRSRLVLGKAGFQQIAEALLMGAPIVCRACGGGITEHLIASYMKPHVRIVESDWDLGPQMDTVKRWLASPPIETWSRIAAEAPDPTEHAARALDQLIRERQGGRFVRAPRAHSPVSAGDDQFLKTLLEQKRWPELREVLKTAHIWLYDRAVTPGEFVDALEVLLRDAVDTKLLQMRIVKEESRDGRAHRTTSGCLMWGVPGSWHDHDVAFDLHFGFEGHGDERRVTYLGVTYATPERGAAQ